MLLLFSSPSLVVTVAFVEPAVTATVRYQHCRTRGTEDGGGSGGDGERLSPGNVLYKVLRKISPSLGAHFLVPGGEL
jgi:hypothetical protein